MNEQEDVEERLKPYLYIRDHDIRSFEELDEFKEKFPDCSDSLIIAIWARLIKKQHGVRVLGF